MFSVLNSSIVICFLLQLALTTETFRASDLWDSSEDSYRNGRNIKDYVKARTRHALGSQKQNSCFPQEMNFQSEGLIISCKSLLEPF